MFYPPFAYQKNRWLQLLFPRGWEDPGWGQFGRLQAVALNPQPLPPVDPQPDPWRIAVVQLAEAAQAKALATRLPEGKQKNALVRSATTAVNTILDDWCGTRPKYPFPWPWPGPPPWVWDIAAELSLQANRLQPGSLRDEMEKIAAEALQKANIEG